jgi:hypothetical protein
MWDQSTQAATFDYIGSATVGTNPLDVIVFGNIPQTYTHLQLRGLCKTTRNYSGNNVDWIYCTANSDAPSHNGGRQLSADGSTTHVDNNISVSWMGTVISSSTFVTGYQYLYSPVVIDIFDYSSTSKYKSMFGFAGFDVNSTSYPNGNGVGFSSNTYKQLTPLTSIALSNFVQWATGTTFALYGIK